MDTNTAATTTTTTTTVNRATTATTGGFNGNPNYTVVDVFSNGRSGGVPSYVTLPGMPPGLPVVQMTQGGGTGGGGGGKGGGGGAGKEKDKGGGAGGGGKAPLGRHLSMVEKIRAHMLRELSVFMNKMGDPWYRFAGLYAGEMGGTVRVDEIMASYPYDFYTAPMWDERKRLGTGFLGLEEEFEEESNASKRYADRNLEAGERAKILKETLNETVESTVNQWSTLRDEIVQTLGLVKPEPGIIGYVDPMQAASEKLDKAFKSIYEKAVRKIQKDVDRIMLHDEEEGKSARHAFDAVSRSFGKFYDLGRESTNLDMDYILYGSGSTTNGNDFDSSLQNMGLCLLKPEFKGLVEGSVGHLNTSCNPKKDFTAYELITSPGVDCKFALFLALRSTPSNPKIVASRRPFGSGGSGGTGGGAVYGAGGNVTNIYANTSTKVNSIGHTVSMEAAYVWFSNVERNDDGVLEHVDNGGYDGLGGGSRSTSYDTGTMGGANRRNARGAMGIYAGSPLDARSPYSARPTRSGGGNYQSSYQMPAIGANYPYYGGRSIPISVEQDRYAMEEQRKQEDRRIRNVRYGREWMDEYY